MGIHIYFFLSYIILLGIQYSHGGVSMKNEFEYELVEKSFIMDNVENDIYTADFVDKLLEDDALSFEEAAFMSGYSEFS